MADDQELNQEQKKQQENNKLRLVLSNAYAALLGNQNTRSFSSYTFEEAMDAHIEQIDPKAGASTPTRPTRLERVNKIENELIAVLEEIKDTPPEHFEKVDNTPDLYTNTAEDPDDEESGDYPTGEDTYA